MTEEILDVIKAADRNSDDMQKIGRWTAQEAEDYVNRVIKNLYMKATDESDMETLEILMKMEVI